MPFCFFQKEGSFHAFPNIFQILKKPFDYLIRSTKILKKFNFTFKELPAKVFVIVMFLIQEKEVH